jgi:hypothetical protein
MTSAAQFAANQANAQHSTGPTTPEGKQRTSLNASKHGLTGQFRLLTAAEIPLFDAHCKSILEALAPVGALELDIAQAIAEDRWRLKRARGIDTGIFGAGQKGLLGFPRAAATYEDPEDLRNEDNLIHGRTWLSRKEEFLLLALYEQRINRTIERNMAELRTLRAERQAACRLALEEAQLLSQLALSKGEKYDAAADLPAELQPIGFEFSPAVINRMQRLAEARAYAKNRKPGAPMAAAA